MVSNAEIYSNLRVLIVDDHMVMRTMVGQNLRALGFTQIESVPSGEEALEEIKIRASTDLPYHIIFLDWHMPGIGGLEVLKRCRQDKACDRTAIVMLTAEQQEKSVSEAVTCGANSYMVKPVSQEVLQKNIKTVINWLTEKEADFLKKAKGA